MPTFLIRTVIILTALFFFSPTHSRGEAELDSTNPTYNRALNPLRNVTERIQALGSLLEDHGFTKMELILEKLLLDPKEHIQIKQFIVNASEKEAPATSKLSLNHLLHDEQTAPEVRSLVLQTLWQKGKMDVKEMERIILSSQEPMALREYAVALLRQPLPGNEAEARALLLRIIRSSTADVRLRQQSLASLTNEIDNPETFELFRQIAEDRHETDELRKLALMNLHVAEPQTAVEISWTIIFDGLASPELRQFALAFTPKESLRVKVTELRTLHSKLPDNSFRTELSERLEELKEDDGDSHIQENKK